MPYIALEYFLLVKTDKIYDYSSFNVNIDNKAR